MTLSTTSCGGAHDLVGPHHHSMQEGCRVPRHVASNGIRQNVVTHVWDGTHSDDMRRCNGTFAHETLLPSVVLRLCFLIGLASTVLLLTASLPLCLEAIVSTSRSVIFGRLASTSARRRCSLAALKHLHMSILVTTTTNARATTRLLGKMLMPRKDPRVTAGRILRLFGTGFPDTRRREPGRGDERAILCA